MKYGVAIIAILCLTILEIVALVMGINGALLSIVVSAIAGLGGYSIARARIKPP
jgi:hypothetical protein